MFDLFQLVLVIFWFQAHLHLPIKIPLFDASACLLEEPLGRFLGEILEPFQFWLNLDKYSEHFT